MKLSIDIDCTPQEARAFLGLPDVEAFQKEMMAEVQEQLRSHVAAMDSGGADEDLDADGHQGLRDLQGRLHAGVSEAPVGIAGCPRGGTEAPPARGTRMDSNDRPDRRPFARVLHGGSGGRHVLGLWTHDRGGRCQPVRRALRRRQPASRPRGVRLQEPLRKDASCTRAHTASLISAVLGTRMPGPGGDLSQPGIRASRRRSGSV